MSGAEQSKAFHNMLKEADSIEQDSLIGELEKPDSEIDARHIRELLAAEPIEGDPAQESKALLRVLNDELRREKNARKPRNFGKIIRMAAIAAASLIVFAVFACQTAYALNWTFLIRIFEPVMETFGITWNVNEPFDERDQALQSNNPTSENFGFINETYTDIADVPAEIDGYATMPSSLPEGYEFSNASYIEDFAKKTLVIMYASDSTEITCRIVVIRGEESATSATFEREADSGGTFIINGIDVILSYNEGTVSTSWNRENVYYRLWSSTSEQTILEFTKLYLE